MNHQALLENRLSLKHKKHKQTLVNHIQSLLTTNTYYIMQIVCGRKPLQLQSLLVIVIHVNIITIVCVVHAMKTDSAHVHTIP